MSEALEDFTGGVSVTVNMVKLNLANDAQERAALFTRMQKEAGRKALMAASIPVSTLYIIMSILLYKLSDICPTFALIYCKFYRSNLCSANRKPLTYKFLEFPKQVCVIHCVTPINHTPPVLVMFIITIHNFFKVNILIFSEYFHGFIRLSTCI